MTQVIQILILGLVLGGVYALMSSGMTLIFGVMRVVNLAHSSIYRSISIPGFLVIQNI